MCHGLSNRGLGAVAALWLAVAGMPIAAAAGTPFPEPRPATRAEAAAFAARFAGGTDCLTPAVQALRGQLGAGAPVERLVLALLEQRNVAETARTLVMPDGTRILAPARTFEGVTVASMPDLLQQTAEWVSEARWRLVDGFGLPAPSGLEVLLVDLGPDIQGYLVSRDPVLGSATIVLNSARFTPAEQDGLKTELIHQYAHAVVQAQGAAVPAAWSEAFATWAELGHGGSEDARLAGTFSQRLARLRDGFFSIPFEQSPGNALWLAFLDQAYGPAALGVTLRELAQRGSEAVALDRAMRRISGDGLAAAFREFHLWSVLVGPRSDGRHFEFGGRLEGPRYASTVDTTPALAVHTDPPVGPWGASQIRITPDAREGGLRVRFEGEFAARWEADLLLTDRGGTLRRVPIALSAEGSGEVTVPVGDLRDVLLLVRRLGGDDSGPRRYTYAVHQERGFPFEIAALDASGDEVSPEGIVISWDTLSERDVIGFNVLRSRGAGFPEVVVNPVWVPAVGDPGHATSYRFLDPTAELGTTYLYRVQGVTTSGLTSESSPVSGRRSGAAARP